MKIVIYLHERSVVSGGSRIFSRWSILTTFFFRLTKMIFRSSPKALKRRFLGKFLKKQVKKPFLGIFWKTSTNKKIAFFLARAPLSKLVYFGAEGAFRKSLGSVGQQWISRKVPKGGPFGSAGGRISE